ncbi:hypothetical protein F53441_6475 [Fusarium austroafricanum]|uniref:CENP-V/GFA domain-containing protein n=1 Tax=Fusarium austroafricanum TaxID=2364996 RepID=A0A8H4KIM8_9HYPO|nr:hypothetical protein F53441_6475 [Fusarium austroafricanum]
MASSSTSTSKIIEGGCLCESCRKQTGSFFLSTFTVPVSAIEWQGDSEKNIKRYSKTEGIKRGFCGNCGSFLFWHPDGQDISMALGSLDALYLFGEGAEDTKSEVPSEGYAKEILSGHFNVEFCESEIKGVPCKNSICLQRHRDVLDKAIRNVLSTELAQFTYAQIIDGLPIADVAWDRRLPRIMGEHIIDDHETLCPGALENAQEYYKKWDPSFIKFNPDARDIEAVTNWTLPSSETLLEYPPGPTLFSHHDYRDDDIYPEGIADILRDEQHQALFDFLLQNELTLPSPLPILSDKQNRVRVDAPRALTHFHIYRDIWERKPLSDMIRRVNAQLGIPLPRPGHALYHRQQGERAKIPKIPMRTSPILTQSYKVKIEPKPFHSYGVERHEFISKISENDRSKVTAAARSCPALYCQRWIVNVLCDLEQQQLAPKGTWEKWTAAMEVDPYSDDGAPSTESKKSSSDDNSSN